MATFRGNMQYVFFILEFEDVANEYNRTRIAYDSRFGIDGQVFEYFGNFSYEEDVNLDLTDYDGVITGLRYTNYRAGLPSDYAEIRHVSLPVAELDSSGEADLLRRLFAGSDLVQGGSDDPNYTGDEREVLNGYGGNDRIFGYAASDRIDGGAGNDYLNGGTGLDLMIGGTGNDTFVADETSDRIVERVGQGYDTVSASVSYSLRGKHLEGITLVGEADITAVGNELGNKIVGNSGNNKLYGGAGNDALHSGLGRDALFGGAGNDSFVFDTALGNGNVDLIFDFADAVGDNDSIRLDRGVFTVLDRGRLAAETFQANAAGIATETDDRIIYSTNSGSLSYDQDGSGDGLAVRFAVVKTASSIGAADFLVI